LIFRARQLLLNRRVCIHTIAILAGGLATRLRPLTEQTPKSLIEINGEPFIAHQLRLLKARGIEKVIICVGYLGELIQRFVGDGQEFGMEVQYSSDWPELLGTAGAVKRALPLLGDSFFVLYGDSFLPCDYRAVGDALVASSKAALMTVFRNENNWDTSNVEFEDGRILVYDKRTHSRRMRHIDYGLGAFHQEAFADVPERSAVDLADLYRKLLTRGELAGFEVHDRFYEIGSLQGIRNLSELLRSGA